MNLSIVATLDTRYQKKDGTCAVIVRIGRNNQTLPISTGFSLPPRFWDEKKRQVKAGYDGVSSVVRLNNQIAAEVKAVRDVALELHEAGTLDTLSLADVKARITKQRKGYSFLTFAGEVIDKLHKANRIGTKNSYQDAIKALENFHGNKMLGFKEITFEYLTDFETDHLSRGNGLNGLAAYLRAIRAIYNLAIKSNVVAEKYYPFKKYKIKTEPTSKRALPKDLLAEIFKLSLDEKHPCFHARNYFVISYMLYGMNFYDIALLRRKSHFVDGRVQYQRSKTSKSFDVKISPSLEKLLAFYEQPGDGYFFDIVKRDTADHIDKDIKWARKRYNKKLKTIAEMCGIETNLTSYVSRHSFATHARLENIPVDAISAMLGHSSIKTTQIYLASLPNHTLDDYNAQVIEGRIFSQR